MASLKNIGNFIFELGAEELPAGQILNISNHIKEKISAALNEAEIKFNSINTEFTPRRLLFVIDELQLDAIDKEVEIKGPPEKIAKAEDGSLAQAAQGFLKKNNLTEDEIYWQDGYLYAKQTIKGQTAKLVLEAAIPEIIASTPGVRFMRWRDGDLKFARPLQWIIAMLEDGSNQELLDFEIEGLKPSNTTRGHRFLGSDSIAIKNIEDYFSKLEENGVYVRSEARKEKIVKDSEALAESLGGKIICSDDLLDEVILITENPSPILCEFDEAFLQVPGCVLTTVMVNHQRYIPVEKDGKLLPKFIAISNNPLEKARGNIKEGNEKVIVPRFKDAEFFVQEDSKTSLEDRVAKLERLNSLKGTMAQKAKRMQKIAERLVDELAPNFATNPAKSAEDKLDESIKADVLKAALLAKTDLSTNLVFEFTELQGEIGGIYAARQNHSSVVADAISDHYKPRFAGDEAPGSIGSKIIAIADKLDNIVTAFALGKIPSGSADPFALRRQANGMLEIIIHSHLIIDLAGLIDFIAEIQEAEFGQGEIVTKMKGRGEKRQEVKVPELNWEGTADKVKDFISSRLGFVFEICHKDTEVNSAVLSPAGALKELNKRHMMIHLLYSLKSDAGYASLVEAVTRVLNISKDEVETADAKAIDEKLFEDNSEKELLEVVKPLDVNGDQNFAYEPILNPQDILKATPVINKFFDSVLVNAEDEKIKKNRRALVAYVGRVFREIGDFSML